ncbi:MAG: DUF1015 domain-containing protein [Rubrivivax sp.]|nr:DUF1015 domain-containing protein [Rubrivivax sp.]
MATVAPFRALRYSLARIGDLSRVIAPPYDVYGPDERDAFCREPHSIVHLDCNAGSTDPSAPDNRYARAAATLRAWLEDGLLARDPVAAIYAYEQEYRWGDETLPRRSFIARVRLERFGEGRIYPHERTFSGPKEDRYQLTLATRCNLSQPLAFYLDPAGEALAPLLPAFERPPDMTATGPDGVINRLWGVTHADAVAAVQAALAERDLFIADGHHRYETSLRYLEQLGEVPPDHPARFVACVCVGSGDPGLRVMPTHRVLSGLDGFGVPALVEAAAEAFEWRPVDGGAAGLEAALEAASETAMGVLAADGAGLLVPRSGGAPDSLGVAAPLRRLNVTILDDWLRPTWLTPRWGAGTTAYVHRVEEAAELLAGGAQVAFLLRACPLQTILDVAAARELMPQKSTYFYPKVATGLVINPLTDDL